MELYDKDGKLVEGALTKEEAETAQTTAVTAAETAAIEKYKTENPTETPEEKTAREAREKAAENEKTPAEIASEAAAAAVAAAFRARDIQDLARAYAPGDLTKQAEIVKNATEKVQGFEATPEGLISQVEAAAGMAGIDTKSVDISSLSMTGGNRNVDVAPTVANTEADAIVQKALGITPEDVAKYGGVEETKTT